VGRLAISDEVRALLSTATIQRLLAQREHTELNCVICGGSVPPEAPDIMSVLVRFDLAGGHVAQYAHESCAPSHVDRSDVVVAPNDEHVIYTPALLVRRRVRAALIWEPRRPAFDMSRSEAVAVMAYRDLGFAASDAGLAAIYGPTPAGLVLEGNGAQLLLRSREGPFQDFDDIAAIAPPGWLEAARSERRCLLIVGETLGVERFSEERLDALLADGRAVAAVALTKIART